MPKLAEIRELIEQARQAHMLAEKALEPDPNADPVTFLDQQWEQEKAKYIGINYSNSPRSHVDRFALIIICLVFFGLGIALWLEDRRLPTALASVVPLFLIGLSLLMVLALPTAIKVSLAERRYRKKRASLVKYSGDPRAMPELPISAQRLRYSWPKKSRSEAETRFHELQAEYYGLLNRDQTYYEQIQRFIDHAPEADQRYLSELAQLEQSWVNSRSSQRQFTKEVQSYQSPSTFGAWIMLGFGLGLLGFGVMLFGHAKPTFFPPACCGLGFIMALRFPSVRKRAHAAIEVEQRYFAQRQHIIRDYGH